MVAVAAAAYGGRGQTHLLLLAFARHVKEVDPKRDRSGSRERPVRAADACECSRLSHRQLLQQDSPRLSLERQLAQRA